MSQEHDLNELLRSLPREQASPGFTARVLAKTREAETARRGFWGLPLERSVMAAAALFFVLAGAVFVQQHVQEQQRQARTAAAVARIEALELERTQLEQELLELQREAREAQGVIYLGSTPEMDMVLDMGRLARRSDNIRPAAATGNPVRPIYSQGKRQ